MKDFTLATLAVYLGVIGGLLTVYVFRGLIF